MAKDLMPEKLKDFLKALSPADKEQAWKFFDSDPSALERMIAMVGEKYASFGDYLDRNKKP